MGALSSILRVRDLNVLTDKTGCLPSLSFLLSLSSSPLRPSLCGSFQPFCVFFWFINKAPKHAISSCCRWIQWLIKTKQKKQDVNNPLTPISLITFLGVFGLVVVVLHMYFCRFCFFFLIGIQIGISGSPRMLFVQTDIFPLTPSFLTSLQEIAEWVLAHTTKKVIVVFVELLWQR